MTRASLGSNFFAIGEVKGMRKLLCVLFEMLLLGRLEAASACLERYPPRSDADLFEDRLTLGLNALPVMRDL